MTLPLTQLITEKRGYLDFFNRNHYKEYFQKYCEESAEIFDELSAAGEAAGYGAYQFYTQTAGRLIDELEACWDSQERKKRRRELQKERDKTLIAVFVIPAAIAYGEGCAAFADALSAVWNGRYPKDRLHVGRFEDIAAGFAPGIKWFSQG